MYEAFHGTDKLQPAPHTLRVAMRQLTDEARRRLHCVTLLRAASGGGALRMRSSHGPLRRIVERLPAETVVSHTHT